MFMNINSLTHRASDAEHEEEIGQHIQLKLKKLGEVSEQ